jgi:transcriptional regulator with XRE-family HTH domain
MNAMNTLEKRCFVMTNFPANLKYLREERNLSQQEIANIIGIKQRTYSNYERGYTEPSLEILLKISKLFRTSLDMLVGIALDVALNKDDRAFIGELAEKSELGNTKLVGEIYLQGAEVVDSKITGRKPRVLNQKIMKTAKEIKRNTAQ